MRLRTATVVRTAADVAAENPKTLRDISLSTTTLRPSAAAAAASAAVVHLRGEAPACPRLHRATLLLGAHPLGLKVLQK